ncbi:MAG: hypothetical protein COZ06_03430 [Armatimonadetes bacterium CG_4_10_14_3_um_filter_66_18]|nr:hypothetical protein [Armatimonadota bacterium]OIP05930.1 MAG: hypothetical protein AUJ96_09930 [Armatimonadetes bacterium CG2_30_66_41]PIU92547.1 MAG: hypothetical protein COS65_17325 [Armatimonadetes bacterium CG06_land_8_20_14_3_00_66_21]PIW13388.1 MAG: hypothetical protein COW34_09845 [Armatimonadetes bacterium CG17_big_fil_post_rev_8_21_14_2_50_66_6]PIX45362.1 MAG: hypothetical protein COZ57_15525 [Armatimonadetes bacterium CG_4_8_14_3_um_filter_66_20]PIY52156.1 MAG: hypothetical prote
MLSRMHLAVLAVAIVCGAASGPLDRASADPVEASVKGLKVSIPRRAYLRGEEMPILVASEGTGSVELALRVEGKEQDATLQHLIAQVPAGKTQTVPFGTWEVHPGAYELRATLRDNMGNYGTAVDLAIVIVSLRRPGITLGTIDVPAGALKPANLHALTEQGFNVVYYRFADPTAANGLRDLLDVCYSHGLLSVPILDTRTAIRWDDALAGPRSQAGIDASEWAQLLRPSLEPVYDQSNFPVLCPRNPKAMALVAQYVKTLAGGAAGHPGVAAVALDRGATLAFDWQGGGIGCFCPHCLSYFREQTGLEPPAAQYVAPGHVAGPTDSFASWLLLMGKPGDAQGGTLEGYNKALKQVVGKLDPQLSVVQLPGGYAGELDASTYQINYEQYRTIETKLAYTMDLARARQGNQKKPVSLVIEGLNPGEGLPNLKAHLQLLSLIAVSRGAQSLTYGPYEATTDERVSGALAEVRPIAEKLGPMLATVTRDTMPIAVLYSGTTEGYQRVLRWQEARDRWAQAGKWFEEPWEHEHSFYLGYSALLRNGLPVEIVTEPDVLGGRLAEYQALVLIDHEYSTEALEKKIREFQDSGKLVFADQSSVVRPPRAVAIPTDFSGWSQLIPLGLRNPDPAVADIVRERQSGLIREAAHYVGRTVTGHVPSPVKVSPAEVLYTTARNGESRYLLLVNPELEKPVDVSVSVVGEEDFVYDLLESKRVLTQRAGERIEFATQLAPAALRAFLLSPREITHLRVATQQTDRKVRLNLSVGGEAGLRVSGSHPLKITLTDSAGRELPESGYYATNAGRLSLELQLAKAEPAGKWTITVSELASGLVRTQQFEVK